MLSCGAMEERVQAITKRVTDETTQDKMRDFKLHLEKKGKPMVFEQESTIVGMRFYFLQKFQNSV